MTVSAFVCAIAALLQAPIRDVRPPAKEGQWLGTWTLNRSRSTLVGPSIRIDRTAHGYRFDFGAARFEVGDDGRDYPTVPTRTTSIKPIGPLSWQRIHKVAGKEVDRSRLTISRNQHSLLIETTAIAFDGKTNVSHETLRRTEGRRGLAGVWRSSSKGVDVSRHIVISGVGDGRQRIDYPDDGQYYVLALDGSASPLQGARAVPSVTMTLYRDSPTRRHWTELVDAKPYRQGIDRLLPDGRSFEERSWPVILPTEVQRAVYVRD